MLLLKCEEQPFLSLKGVMMKAQFLSDSGAEYPIIGGPMYPCSNPELVSAVSNAGGIGIVQPLTLTYVEGYDLREGLRYIRSMTERPIGMNALIEKSSKKYEEKMKTWVDIALEEGVRFFITSLGKPDWVVQKVHACGGKVYHDVTDAAWAEIALRSGVDGFIAVNNRAGGHAGLKELSQLLKELQVHKLPVVCAGGISDKAGYEEALSLGYSAVQMGTRFIASNECKASDDYKQAIVEADEEDIVLTQNITGIPVSVINTGYIKKLGLLPGRFAKWMLTHPQLKYLIRMIYALRSLKNLKKGMNAKKGEQEFWQAGKSVKGITKVKTVEEIFDSILH